MYRWGWVFAYNRGQDRGREKTLSARKADEHEATLDRIERVEKTLKALQVELKKMADLEERLLRLRKETSDKAVAQKDRGIAEARMA